MSNQQATHAEKVMSEEHEKENALEADSKIQILYPGRGHAQVISEWSKQIQQREDKKI